MIKIHFWENIREMENETGGDFDYCGNYYCYGNNINVCIAYDWETAKRHFQKAISDLSHDYDMHTLQMSFLTKAWDLHFEHGARVFIHDHTGTYELLEGDNEKRTDKYLRRAHNIFKMWQAGSFWTDQYGNEHTREVIE